MGHQSHCRLFPRHDDGIHLGCGMVRPGGRQLGKRNPLRLQHFVDLCHANLTWAAVYPEKMVHLDYGPNCTGCKIKTPYIKEDDPFASQSPTTKVDSAAFFSFSPVGASYPNSLVWIDPSELSEVRWSHTAKTAHQLPSKEGCPCSRSLVLRVEWVGEKDKWNGWLWAKMAPIDNRLLAIHHSITRDTFGGYPFASHSPTTKVDSAAFFSFSPVGASYPNSLVWIDPLWVERSQVVSHSQNCSPIAIKGGMPLFPLKVVVSPFVNCGNTWWFGLSWSGSLDRTPC